MIENVVRRRVVARRVGRDFLSWLKLSPEGGHLDDLRPELDVSQPESPADDPAIAKQFLDLIRVRRGADVEVLRTPRQQQVPDAAADQIGDVIELSQAIENLQRVRVDVAARDRVLGARNDARLSHRGHCTKTLRAERASACVFRRLVALAIC